MLTIRSENFIKFTEDFEKSVVRVDLDVDTVGELPKTDGISGKTLYQGSLAYVIQSGELYVLSGDGKWYSSEGDE